MSRTSLLSIAAMLMIAYGPPPPAQAQQDVSAEIQAANARFVAVFSAGDAAAVAALYTADGQLLPPNGDVVSGTEAIQTFWQGAMDAGIASATLTTVEAMGLDSLAYEVGRYALVSSDGTPIDEGKYIVIWHRTPDGWRLHRDIWNTSRPPSE